MKKQGISLIVLVITIIIMIILAGTVVISLSDTNIIQRAEEVVDDTNKVQIQELANLGWLEAYMKGKRTQPELEQAVQDYLAENGVDDNDLKDYIIDVTIEEVIIRTIPDDWKENVIDIVDGVPIPKGFVASKAKGENTKSGGLVIYEGTDPVTDENVETAKRTRNQYVWIPIAKKDFTTKFVRQSYNDTAISNELGVNYWEVVLDSYNMPDATANQNTSYVSATTLQEVQSMYASVKKYEGFYVARYEAGKAATENSLSDEDVVIYSQMNKIPYISEMWTEAADGVVGAARSVYPSNNSNFGVTSTLIYGVQWDSILEWFLDKGILTQAEVTENSSHFGNYLATIISSPQELNDGAQVSIDVPDSVEVFSGQYVLKDNVQFPKTSDNRWFLSTGALKSAEIKNIYDMAGNVPEWTMEFINKYPLYRGIYLYKAGGATTEGNLSTRGATASGGLGDLYQGFRVSLYIK